MGKVELDQEWVQLITEARKVGIQKEDISLFLKEKVIVNQLVVETNTERKLYE